MSPAVSIRMLCAHSRGPRASNGTNSEQWANWDARRALMRGPSARGAKSDAVGSRSTVADAFHPHEHLEMERAFYASDPAWDGRFVVAVRTTGIFCRPSCRVRKPLPKNVDYLPDARHRARRRLPRLPALPAGELGAGDAAPDRDAHRTDDDRCHRQRGRAVRLHRAADDAGAAGLHPTPDRADDASATRPCSIGPTSSSPNTSTGPARSSSCRR